MAWNYSGDPSDSARDAIRLLIGDTDTSDQLLNDEEIAWVNTQASGSPTATTALHKAAAQCMRAIASKWTRLADQSVGDLKVSLSQKAESALVTARELDLQAAGNAGVPVPFAGGISKADKETREADTNRVDPFFVTNQFPNITDPGAGAARVS
jgi:hypothetical protein